MDLAITKKLWKDMDSIRDSFSKDLVDLWQKREMQGVIFSLHEDLRTASQTVGYILVELGKNNEATIRGFWIDSNFRDKHLGTELLEAVCGWCDTVGNINKLYVNITDSRKNIHMYEKQGFVIFSRRVDFPDQLRAVRNHA